LIWEPQTDQTIDHPVPKKLEYKWSSPMRIFKSCADKRHRWVLHTRRKKLVKININRLYKFEPWSDDTLFTDETLQALKGLKPDMFEEEIWEDKHRKGEMVVVRLSPNKDNPEPFMVGRILDISEKGNHKLQWFGSFAGTIAGKYLPGWVDKKNVRYFSKRPQHKTHKPFTNDNEHGRVDEITTEHLYPVRFEVTAGNRLPATILQKLHEDKEIMWSKPGV
jgi:hypothetical protein